MTRDVNVRYIHLFARQHKRASLTLQTTAMWLRYNHGFIEAPHYTIYKHTHSFRNDFTKKKRSLLSHFSAAQAKITRMAIKAWCLLTNYCLPIAFCALSLPLAGNYRFYYWLLISSSSRASWLLLYVVRCLGKIFTVLNTKILKVRSRASVYSIDVTQYNKALFSMSLSI